MRSRENTFVHTAACSSPNPNPKPYMKCNRGSEGGRDTRRVHRQLSSEREREERKRDRERERERYRRFTPFRRPRSFPQKGVGSHVEKRPQGWALRCSRAGQLKPHTPNPKPFLQKGARDIRVERRQRSRFTPLTAEYDPFIKSQLASHNSFQGLVVQI